MRTSVFALLTALTVTSVSAPLSVSTAMEMAAVEAGPLKISGAWAKAMLPGQPVGAGYLIIENTGSGADRLLSVTSAVSPDVEIHEMKMEGDVMKMRALSDGLELPAGGTVELKPGGFHLMFMGVAAPFKEGDALAVKLKFEKAGEVELTLPVGAADAAGHSQGG